MYTTTSDKTLTCADCGQGFVFTTSEQQFYADRGFSEPRRCSACRAARKASREGAGGDAYGGGRAYDRGPREMFTVTCSRCGQEAQVPFRPNGAKPVYCATCFAQQRRGY